MPASFLPSAAKRVPVLWQATSGCWPAPSPASDCLITPQEMRPVPTPSHWQPVRAELINYTRNGDE
ncbi:hypothetical protein IMCC9480_2324 [Oxalobacteraceae bacterium IMCC9480]|nr:hypothetical protein IMCC9480_2324 [Oxalobacteraceae bacterium IMCC9480]